MIGGKNILKIAKHAAKRNKGSFDVALTHPGREWVVGILVSVCAIFTLGGYAWFTYRSQLMQLEEPVSIDGSLVEYKQEKAREVLELFGDRKRQFEALRADKPTMEKAPIQSVIESDDSLAGVEGTP